MMHPLLSNKNSSKLKHKRSRGRLITLIDLAIIATILITLFPRLQNKVPPATQYMGYRITLNSISFNNQTLVELRTKREADAMTEAVTLTFYDDDLPIQHYSLILPASEEEQVNEFVLPPLQSPTLKATLQHEDVVMALTSRVKAIVP